MTVRKNACSIYIYHPLLIYFADSIHLRRDRVLAEFLVEGDAKAEQESGAGQDEHNKRHDERAGDFAAGVAGADEQKRVFGERHQAEHDDDQDAVARREGE